MKRVICVVLALAAASCEPIDEDATETTVSAVRPRSTFTRYVPLAPAGPRVVPWTPGMALVPRGYAPRSFWVVYAGKERTTSTVEAAGFDGDMLEAQAFAFLALRVKLGLPLSAPGTTGVPSPIVGGRISMP